ncbi:Cof-type HAD-IIB family hydrolase [Agathobacter sp.]|uniref:Cof-type HAD-IIB family hydrolase n=1 Tax=Agathobacter sp. TaxID=2021311 RepID=UPI002591299C|nr:Cof-type HAD-IIB family hydrolase [Agathobacter sp.]
MIKLVAIDLDGTLFDNHSQVPQANREAIFDMAENGIYPVISTGRPFNGIPAPLKEDLPFAYAITSNGAGVYEVKTGKCIFEAPMPADLILPIIDYLDTKHCHMDAFINGIGVSTFRCKEHGKKLPLPASLLEYVLHSRKRVERLQDYITQNQYSVQKMTLNFYNDKNGVAVDREEIREYLTANGQVDVVCGGYNNLEFTRHGVNKGLGLQKLAEHLNLTIDETMAIGDTENDLSIVKAAGIGVAMGNATDEIKEASDYITDTNEQSGVASAIYHFCGDSLRNHE